jgi:hypothetical protein
MKTLAKGVMESGISDSESIKIANWERRKDDLGFVQFFCPLYEHKELLQTVDPDELYDHLKQLWDKWNTKHYFAIISSDPSNWLPDWFWATIQWTVGSKFFWSPIDSLGISLLKQNRRDLLPLLGKAGDKKAKMIKKRSRLPKELIGKQLEWTKLDHTTWTVTILPERETQCEYDKLYDRWFGEDDD